MVERTDEECFAIVKSARQQLKNMPASKGSDATIKGYVREFDRLVGETGREPAELWSMVCDTNSKRTYYRRVAALKHNLRLEIEAALRRQDQHQRAKDATAWRAEIDYLSGLLKLAQLIESARGQCPLENPQPRHSKRQDLRGLQLDWREQMSKSMRNSKYHLSYLIAAVTGCRPDELQSGVQVCLLDEQIEFTIIGSKVKDSQGQPVRAITYSITEPHSLIQEVLAYLNEQNTKEMTVSVSSKVNFTSAIRSVGRRLWPRRQTEITPYCLRHAAACDFKSCLDADQVSAALGHAVDATATMYGQRQMSRGGGLQPVFVNAQRTIKPTRTAPPSNIDSRRHKMP